MFRRLLSLRLAVAAAIAAAFGLLAYGIGQETPVGSLRGRVVARETGAPLKAEVTIKTYAREGYAPMYYYSTKCAADGSFEFRRVEEAAYKLEVRSAAHHMKPASVIIEEGRTQNIEVELEPDPPSLQMYIHQHVFTPDETPQVTCHGFLDGEALDLQMYKVDVTAFFTQADGSLQRLLGVPQYYYDRNKMASLKLGTNPALKLAGERSIRITKRDAEGVFTQRLDLPVLGPGLYVAAVNSGGLQSIDWILVTSLGLVAKTAGSQVLAYTVDLKSGRPVPGASVEVLLDNKPVASGTSGADGRLYLTIPQEEGRPDQAIIARSGGSVAFLSAYSSSERESNRTIYTYTERPVYRPGQSVFYKGIVRSRVDGGGTYRTPAPQPIDIEVYDPDDTLIYRGTKTTSKFGSFSGSVPLSSEAPTGVYSIRTGVKGEGSSQQSANFTIAAYRKPEFSVKAAFDKKRYTRGEWVKARVAVNYYFGSPVANAEVYYSVTRSDYWLFTDDDYAYDYESEGYSDYGGYGESVSEGTIHTDENGEAIIEFPADWEQPGEDEWYDTDKQFSISLSATDKAGANATGEASVLVTRGQFALSSEPDCYIAKPGSTVSVSIRARDYDRRPVRNQDVTVTLNRERWDEDDGYSLTPVEDKQVTTDDLGRATVKLRVKRAGSMVVSARSRDRRGNEIVSTSYVWVCSDSGMEECFDPSLQGVDIHLDKREYKPGDTAQVLIMTNRPGGSALVTIEGSRIYESRVVRLAGKSTILKFAVKDDYKPNFYVSVCSVRKKSFDRKELGARVSIKSEALSVKVTPGRKKYKPGEQADYSLKVTDSQGRPVSAELSMGVVDEAIYAIQPERTTPILDYFYARRDNLVRTYDSFPQIYLSDPDKAGSPLAKQQMKIRVRKRFLDTAYWSPSIVTNANGEARVSFKLPDNLTTWRATVRGVTANTQCGQSTNTVISRQPMLVRLEMPRFLVQRDNSILTAVVHNYTGKEQRVKVTLRAPRLHVTEELAQTVLVENDGSARVDWSVSASRPGTFAVGVRAEGETAGDAVQLDLPVKPHGPELSTSTSAVLADRNELRTTVYVRNDAIPEATRLKVRLAPSLASTILGSLDYLAQYPYGCTEQTVSCFLPDVVLYQSLKSLGMRNKTLEAELPDMVQKGFARLYRFQLDDGGWGWCEYGKSDPWMTAYVCYALVRAKEAGFPVKDYAMQRGLDALRNFVASRKTYLYPKAFGCYTLALAGRDVTAELDALARRRKLNNETLAAIALAYQRLGQQDKAQAALARFLQTAITSGDGIHWKGGYRYDGGDVEPTALGLEAMLKIAPDDPRVYAIVRWLMKTRKDDYWYSTRGTAMSLYAMSEFLKKTNELTPNESVTVLVNGKVAGTTHFTQASIYKPQVEFRITDLRKGRNELMIRRSGAGNVYYSTNLTQYISQKTMPAVVSGSGLTVTRAYYAPPSSYYQGRSYDDYGRPTNADPGSPVSGCDTGRSVLVRLTVHATSSFQHMLVEDFIPAGCEIIDRGEVSRWEWGNWWNGQDIRDDKVSFYIDYLPPGKHVVEYQMRSGFAGRYSALPAQVFSMYDPAVRATTEESGFSIR